MSADDKQMSMVEALSRFAGGQQPFEAQRMGLPAPGLPADAPPAAPPSLVTSAPAPEPEQTAPATGAGGYHFNEQQLRELEAAQLRVAELEAMITSLKDSRAEYNSELAALGIDPGEPQAVLDAALTQPGGYQRSYRLFGRVEATFTLRRGDSQRELNEMLEAKRPVFAAVMVNMTQWHNLCHSLVRYGDREFNPKTPAGRAMTHQFLGQLEEPVLNALLNALNKFDRLVSLAFSEHSRQDF